MTRGVRSDIRNWNRDKQRGRVWRLPGDDSKPLPPSGIASLPYEQLRHPILERLRETMAVSSPERFGRAKAIGGGVLAIAELAVARVVELAKDGWSELAHRNHPKE